MKERNKMVFFEAIVLSIVMITSSAGVIAATYEDFEANVKVVKMKATPEIESLEVTGVKEARQINGLIGTDSQITTAEENELQPAIGMDGIENLLLAYTFEEDVSSNYIPWRFSSDDGATWDPGIYYLIEGTESHPAIDYEGHDMNLAGTLQGDPVESDGAIQYLFECTDTTDSETYSLVHWDWAASYPYSDRLIPDIGGYDGLSAPDWWYGIIGCVGTRGDPGSVDMPIFNYYDYNDTGQGWSSYFANYSGCENVAVEVDQTNGHIYAVFDYFNDSDWDLLLFTGDCHPVEDNESGTWHPEWYPIQIIGDIENTTYPAIGVRDGNVIILAQTDEAGTQDIVCYYSSDGGENWDKSFVAEDSEVDELYPTIISYGEPATCTFIVNGDLFTCVTDDGGETWSAPEKVNDEDGTVESEFRNVDITYDGNVVWTDNRNENLDIYFDYLGGAPPHPVIEIVEFTFGIGKVNVVIKNVGDIGATNVDWSISVKGGILGRIDVLTEGTIASLDVGEEVTVSTDKFIFGLGSIDIVVTASCAEAVPPSVKGSVTGTLIIFFFRI